MSGYKNLAVNTALFAANAVATRLMTFLLVPLYTYYMRDVYKRQGRYREEAYGSDCATPTKTQNFIRRARHRERFA